MKISKFISHKFVILSLVFSLLTGLDTLVIPVLVNGIIDSVQTGNLQKLCFISIYGIVGFAFLRLTLFLWQLFENKLLIDFTIKLKSALFRQFFNGQESTEAVQNMMYHDVAILQNDYVDSWLHLVYCIWFSGISTIYIFRISWQVSLIFISFSVIPLLVPKLFSKVLGEANLKSSKSNEEFVKEVNENVRAIPVIKHYQRLSYFVERFNSQLRRTEKSRYRLASIRNWMNLTVGIVGGVAGLLPFALGGWLATEGRISIGGLVAVFLASDRVLSPLENALVYWSNITSARPVKHKIEQYLLVSHKDIEEIKTSSQVVDSVIFEDLQVGYSHPLFALSACLKQGEKVLLIGASGSGKTSLFKTIFGEILPLSGRLLLNHRTIDKYSQDNLYGMIGYIPQEVIMFDESIRFNISLGEEFSDKDIEEVLHLVGLSQLLSEKGLYFRVGENGEYLSGGERARLIIARALVRRYQIILIDEFSASLDKTVACHIRQILLNTSLTIIEIAHHYTKEEMILYDKIWEILPEHGIINQNS